MKTKRTTNGIEIIFGASKRERILRTLWRNAIETLALAGAWPEKLRIEETRNKISLTVE